MLLQTSFSHRNAIDLHILQILTLLPSSSSIPMSRVGAEHEDGGLDPAGAVEAMGGE